MMSKDKLAEALRRAFALGQTYWQQADSESHAQNAKSEVTHQKFRALLEETVAALDAKPAPVEPVSDTMQELAGQSFESLWLSYLDKKAEAEDLREELAALKAAPAAPVPSHGWEMLDEERSAAAPAAPANKAQEALKLIAAASPGEHAFEYMRGIARAALRAAPAAPAPITDAELDALMPGEDMTVPPVNEASKGDIK